LIIAPFERVEELKYSGTTFTNQNSMQEEITSRLKSGSAGYHLMQSLLSSSLLSKNLKIKIYRTVVLPVVLYGCETWLLTFREECRLRVFENRVLRRIFGPKRNETAGVWRKLHNEELNDLLLLTQYCSGDQIEKNEVGGACSTYGESRDVYNILVGNPEGKRPLGRPMHRWG